MYTQVTHLQGLLVVHFKKKRKPADEGGFPFALNLIFWQQDKRLFVSEFR
jgi:hypothetical protein